MAKPTGITGRIRDANAWISFCGRLWQVAQFLGVDGWLAAAFWAVSAAILAGVIYVLDSTSWYWILIASTAFATALLHFWNKLRIAWSLRGVRAFDLEEFARECCDYHREFSDFMASRLEARPNQAAPGHDTDEKFREWWRENEIFSNRTKALVMQRFGPRAFAISHQLKSLGIASPNMFHFPHGDQGGSGTYIGLVGVLLKQGQLEEARKLDPNVTWGATFYS